MRFVIDLNTLDVINSETDRNRVTMVEGKRGDDSPFEVVFVRNGVVEELDGPPTLTFGAKPSGKYDAAAVVLTSAFTASGSGSTFKFSGTPSFNTAELNALFLIDGNDENDPAYVDIMAEFSWSVGSAAPSSSRTFIFRVHNDVLRGDESGPLDITGGTPRNDLTVTVAGTLTDGTDPVVFPVMIYDGQNNSKPKYRNIAADCQVAWSGSTWTLEFPVGEGFVNWTSSEDVATPDLVTTWTPTSPATGTPTVTVHPTPGALGCMQVDTTNLYVVCEVTDGVPLWKKIALSTITP